MCKGHSGRTIARGGGRCNKDEAGSRRPSGVLASAFGLVVSGCGTAPVTTVDLVVRPPRLDFGSVEVGLSSRVTVTIENPGLDTTTIESIFVPPAVAGTLRLINVPAAVGAQTAVDVDVVWTPERRGDLASVVTVRTESEDDITLPVAGRAVVASLVAVPARLDFGATRVGQTSSQTFSLRNMGRDPVRVDSVSPDPAASAAFTAEVRPAVIGPAESHWVTVWFRPRSIGLAQGAIVVADDRNRATLLTVPVSAEAILSELDVSPLALTFQGVFVGEVRTRQIQIRNRGCAPLSNRRLDVERPRRTLRGRWPAIPA